MAEDETTQALTRRLREQLACLRGGSPEAIEETIALWPVGDRLTLAATGIIETLPGEDPEDAFSDFRLTNHGASVIEQCALIEAE